MKTQESMKDAQWQCVVDQCTEDVYQRLGRIGTRRLAQRSDLCRLALYCLEYDLSNKHLDNLNKTDWLLGRQHFEQVAYTATVVERIVEQPPMSPDDTANALVQAYKEMLILREVSRILENRI